MIDLATVLDCFDLRPAGPDRFRAPVAGFPMATWAYGGLLIGQMGLAARATAEGRHLRSMHVGFLSRTDPDRPVELRVERLGDRTTFAHRAVTSWQDGELRVHASVVLHHLEEGPVHQVDMPDVPPPDQCRAPLADGLVLSIRDACEPPLYRLDAADPELIAWYRCTDLPDDPALHEAMFGFASDLSLLETAWRPVEGQSITNLDQVVSNTISHTMWFHHQPRLHDWVLFHGHSPRAAGGRSLCTAHLFTADGELIGSVAQEGLMRIRGAR